MNLSACIVGIGTAKEGETRVDEKIEWVTRSGQRMPISEMSDKHLSNAIECIERLEFTRDAKYRALLAEQHERIKYKIHEFDMNVGRERAQKEYQEMEVKQWGRERARKDYLAAEAKQGDKSKRAVDEEATQFANALQSIADGVSKV